MNFIHTLVAILNENAEIKDLPSTNLIALRGGELVNVHLPIPVLLKLARLQTLKCLEEEKTALPEQSPNTPGSLHEAAHLMTLMSEARADTWLRFSMLDHLITEIVRDTVPSESEMTGYRYTLGIYDGALALFRKQLEDTSSHW